MAARAVSGSGFLSRFMSNKPENVVYQGPGTTRLAAGGDDGGNGSATRVTLRTIDKKFRAGERLTMVTAYDYPSAVHCDLAGIDMCLVGDSAAMVVHGHDTTLPISLDDMITHCKAVARGASRPLLVGDLPFGSYENGTYDAVQSAVRMMKEGGMDCVKLEGGQAARVAAARAIVGVGIAVMGHVGLNPQSISVLGGFRPQAQTASDALRVVKEARALQEAGCFAVVLECVPQSVAAAVTEMLDIPTIGIGAGPHVSGQVLVYHDLLGMMQHPHHAKVAPKFCKQFAQIGEAVQEGLQAYRREVEEGTFPGPEHSPYSIKEKEVQGLVRGLRGMGMESAADAVLRAFGGHPYGGGRSGYGC
ncbi:unnamed protein product [Pedinophyceae sp. YPF-701]|nr:unnamed protein product [Pedinophyceae sp. YPF-701]